MRNRMNMLLLLCNTTTNNKWKSCWKMEWYHELFMTPLFKYFLSLNNTLFLSSQRQYGIFSNTNWVLYRKANRSTTIWMIHSILIRRYSLEENYSYLRNSFEQLEIRLHRLEKSFLAIFKSLEWIPSKIFCTTKIFLYTDFYILTWGQQEP